MFHNLFMWKIFVSTAPKPLRFYIHHIITSNSFTQFSRSWSPFGQPEVGKLTVIKAGPGFHDEKHYDIGPNGKLTEISEIPIHKDACK